MELVYNKSKPVAVTGMAFPTGDVNNFVVGSEEGTVYTACRHGRWFLCFLSGERSRFNLLCKIVYFWRSTMHDFKSISLTNTSVWGPGDLEIFGHAWLLHSLIYTRCSYHSHFLHIPSTSNHGQCTSQRQQPHMLPITMCLHESVPLLSTWSSISVSIV